MPQKQQQQQLKPNISAQRALANNSEKMSNNQNKGQLLRLTVDKHDNNISTNTSVQYAAQAKGTEASHAHSIALNDNQTKQTHTDRLRDSNGGLMLHGLAGGLFA